MSTLLVVGVVFLLAFEKRRRVRWAAFVVIAVLLIGSRSGTGLAGIIFVVTAWNWLRTLVKQQKRMTAPYVCSENVEPTFSMMRRIGFRAFHAHNGALDVVLQVGVIGIVLFVCLFVPTLLSSLRLARRGSSVGAVIVVSGLAIAVMSVSESLFLGPWIPFICLCRGMTLRAEQPARRTSRRYTTSVRSAELSAPPKKAAHASLPRS